MKSLKAYFVQIRREVWEKWPEDRPMSLLASDADALRRRALKGVNAGVQRTLYVQLSRRIDYLAVEAISNKEATGLFWGFPYCDLTMAVFQIITECGSKLVPPGGTFEQPKSVTPGRSYLAPGEELHWFMRVASAIRPEALIEEAEKRRVPNAKQAGEMLKAMVEGMDPKTVGDSALVLVLV